MPKKNLAAPDFIPLDTAAPDFIPESEMGMSDIPDYRTWSKEDIQAMHNVNVRNERGPSFGQAALEAGTGFVKGAAEVLNPWNIIQAVRHPVAPMLEQLDKAGEAYRAGNTSEALARTAAGVVPVMGPALAGVAESLPNIAYGTPEEAGRVYGNIAGMAVGGKTLGKLRGELSKTRTLAPVSEAVQAEQFRRGVMPTRMESPYSMVGGFAGSIGRTPMGAKKIADALAERKPKVEQYAAELVRNLEDKAAQPSLIASPGMAEIGKQVQELTGKHVRLKGESEAIATRRQATKAGGVPPTEAENMGKMLVDTARGGRESMKALSRAGHDNIAKYMESTGAEGMPDLAETSSAAVELLRKAQDMSKLSPLFDNPVMRKIMAPSEAVTSTEVGIPTIGSKTILDGKPYTITADTPPQVLELVREQAAAASKEPVNWNSLRVFRTEVGKMLDDRTAKQALGTSATYALSKLYKATTNDLRNTIAKVDPTGEWGRQFEHYNKITSQMHDIFDKRVLVQMLRSDNPMAVSQISDTLLRGPVENIRIVRSALNQIRGTEAVAARKQWASNTANHLFQTNTDAGIFGEPKINYAKALKDLDTNANYKEILGAPEFSELRRYVDAQNTLEESSNFKQRADAISAIHNLPPERIVRALTNDPSVITPYQQLIDVVKTNPKALSKVHQATMQELLNKATDNGEFGSETGVFHGDVFSKLMDIYKPMLDQAQIPADLRASWKTFSDVVAQHRMATMTRGTNQLAAIGEAKMALSIPENMISGRFGAVARATGAVVGRFGFMKYETQPVTMGRVQGLAETFNVPKLVPGFVKVPIKNLSKLMMNQEAVKTLTQAMQTSWNSPGARMLMHKLLTIIGASGLSVPKESAQPSTELEPMPQPPPSLSPR